MLHQRRDFPAHRRTGARFVILADGQRVLATALQSVEQMAMHVLGMARCLYGIVDQQIHRLRERHGGHGAIRATRRTVVHVERKVVVEVRHHEPIHSCRIQVGRSARTAAARETRAHLPLSSEPVLLLHAAMRSNAQMRSLYHAHLQQMRWCYINLALMSRKMSRMPSSSRLDECSAMTRSAARYARSVPSLPLTAFFACA